MRILINALSLRGGGYQTYLANLLQFLPADRPVDVILLGVDTLQLDVDPALVRRCVAPRYTQKPLARAVWEMINLRRVIREVGADIFFCPGGIVSKRVPPGCKTVTVFHNMVPFDIEQRRRYPLGYQRFRAWMLEKLMLRSMLRADLVVFISNFAKQAIDRFAGGRIRNSVVIPHGVANEFREAPSAGEPALPWLPRSGYFLYVSSFDVYKAHVQVIRAYAKLREVRDTPEKLLLVGPVNFEGYMQEVRREVERLGLTEHVLLPGTVAPGDLPALYRGALVNIFASELENCPNILLESLAAARPLLCSNRPPMPEFGGDAVVYFDPASPQDLADKLLALLDDPARMAELAARGERHSRQFDCEQSARRTWQAVLDLRASQEAPAAAAVCLTRN